MILYTHYLPTRAHDYVALAAQFMEESGLGLEFDPDLVVEYAEAAYEDPDFEFISVYDTSTGRVVGFQVVSRRRMFSRQYVGAHEFLYVHPDYRDFRTARGLLRQTQNWFEDSGCTIVYANSLVGNSEGYFAILRRMGYTLIGDNYVWKQEEA